MARTVEVTVPVEKTEALLEAIKGIDGIVGVTLHRNVSLAPPGDVLSLQVTNDGTRAVFKTLEKFKITEGGSIATSQLDSLLSAPHQNAIDCESSETVWEEMLYLLLDQSNLALNFLMLMMFSGAMATVGFWTNTLYIVIAGQVLGPHFEPLFRIPFGLITGRPIATWRGVIASIFGLAMMALGAAVSLLILRVIDPKSGSLESRSWVQYFASMTHSSVLLAAIAAAAGAAIIMSQRHVLLTGVYLGLNLAPSMSLVGMGLVSGDLPLARKAFIAWAVNAALVILMGGLVLGLKQVFEFRRRALG